jgi:hypothetical protein
MHHLDDIRHYRSVVGTAYEYDSVDEVIDSIKEKIIVPTEAKVRELRQNQ